MARAPTKPKKQAKGTPPTPYTQKMKLQDVIDSNMSSPGRPLVLVGTRQQSLSIKKTSTLLSVKDNLVRIQEQANPIQFLIDAQNGALFTTAYVDQNGDVCMQHYQYSPEERLGVAKFLARSILPSINLTKVVTEGTNEVDPKKGHDASRFDQIIEQAAIMAASNASKVREAEIVHTPRPINSQLPGSGHSASKDAVFPQDGMPGDSDSGLGLDVNDDDC